MGKYDGAALLVIDVQSGIDEPYHAAEGARNNLGAEAAIARLLAAWRARGAAIVHVRHDSRTPESSYRPGQPGHAFKPEVAPINGEAVFAKRANSAFIDTDLEDWLERQAINELVVAGVSTNNSVEATVRMAGNLGFDVTLVEDACFCFGKRDWSGVSRSAEEVHAMSLANMEGEYCAVTTTDAVLAD
jgi:nicotinamidase-related amidase